MSISLHTGVSEIVPQHRVHHNDLPILRDICVVIRAVRAVFGLQGFYIGKGQRIAHQYRNRITVVRDRVASAFILTELRLLRLVHKLLALRVPEPHYQQLIAAVIELHGHIAVAAAVCSDPAADEASSKERDGKNRPVQKGFIRFHSPSG